MKHLIFIFFLLFLTNNVFSQVLTCSIKGTLIHYVNGIDSNEDDSEKSLNQLERYLKPLSHDLDKNGLIDFKYSYNHTYGKVDDLLESGAQLIQLKAASLGLDISIKTSFLILFRALYNLPSLTPIPSILRPILFTIIGDAQDMANKEMQDVETIKSDLMNFLKDNK